MNFQLVCKILENFLLSFISATSDPTSCQKGLAWFHFFVSFSKENGFHERRSKIMHVKKFLKLNDACHWPTTLAKLLAMLLKNPSVN